MTIDEAVDHMENMAKRHELMNSRTVAKEYRLIAAWLRDYKRYKLETGQALEADD